MKVHERRENDLEKDRPPDAGSLIEHHEIIALTKTRIAFLTGMNLYARPVAHLEEVVCLPLPRDKGRVNSRRDCFVLPDNRIRQLAAAQTASPGPVAEPPP